MSPICYDPNCYFCNFSSQIFEKNMAKNTTKAN